MDESPNKIFNPNKRESFFRTDEKCIGCGICAKVCPAEDIVIEDGKPRWLVHCESCMVRFQWCPQKRTRYHNPNITLSEVNLDTV